MKATATATFDAAGLVALAEKYEALASLRRAHDRGEPAPDKATLRRLTERFPGALYELDTLPLAEIDGRAAALRDAAARFGEAERPAWMGWMWRYHVLVREDLARRRDEPKTAAPRPRATSTAIAAIASEAGASKEEVEAALFVRPRRGVTR